jgi:hypothetical protein
MMCEFERSCWLVMEGGGGSGSRVSGAATLGSRQRRAHCTNTRASGSSTAACAAHPSGTSHRLMHHEPRCNTAVVCACMHACIHACVVSTCAAGHCNPEPHRGQFAAPPARACSRAYCGVHLAGRQAGACAVVQLDTRTAIGNHLVLHLPRHRAARRVLHACMHACCCLTPRARCSRERAAAHRCAYACTLLPAAGAAA